MKKVALLVAIVSLAFVVTAWLPRAWAENREEAAVRQTIDYYFQGHATGNGEHHKKAFHPESKLYWVKDGQLMQRTSAEYIAGASGKPAADEAQRKRFIESVDITGNAAVVKLVLDYPDRRFTDYMTLLKINGEWKIINKSFEAEMKKK
jgi:hypothetical protein